MAWLMAWPTVHVTRSRGADPTPSAACACGREVLLGVGRLIKVNLATEAVPLWTPEIGGASAT